jgi:hypothetical protein
LNDTFFFSAPQLERGPLGRPMKVQSDQADVRPHLWAGEELLWCERPSTMGAFLANLRHSFTQANAAVDLFSGPLELFVLLLFFSSVVAVLLVPYLLLVTLGLLTVAVALVVAIAAGITPWLRHRASRALCYAITTRRVLVVRGVDVVWDVHTHWVRARVPWTVGRIGTVVFCRDRSVELEVRFIGVRDPRAVVEIANRAAVTVRSVRAES